MNKLFGYGNSSSDEKPTSKEESGKCNNPPVVLLRDKVNMVEQNIKKVRQKKKKVKKKRVKKEESSSDESISDSSYELVRKRPSGRRRSRSRRSSRWEKKPKRGRHRRRTYRGSSESSDYSDSESSDSDREEILYRSRFKRSKRKSYGKRSVCSSTINQDWSSVPKTLSVPKELLLQNHPSTSKRILYTIEPEDGKLVLVPFQPFGGVERYRNTST